MGGNECIHQTKTSIIWYHNSFHCFELGSQQQQDGSMGRLTESNRHHKERLPNLLPTSEGKLANSCQSSCKYTKYSVVSRRAQEDIFLGGANEFLGEIYLFPAKL